MTAEARPVATAPAGMATERATASEAPDDVSTMMNGLGIARRRAVDLRSTTIRRPAAATKTPTAVNTPPTRTPPDDHSTNGHPLLGISRLATQAIPETMATRESMIAATSR